MPTTLSTVAPERGTYAVSVSFTDTEGAAVVPNAGLTWTLTDSKGAVVNGRDGVALTPAATVTVLLTGLDLAVGGGLEGTQRKLLIQGTYDGVLGVDLPLTDEITFFVADFVKLTGTT